MDAPSDPAAIEKARATVAALDLCTVNVPRSVGVRQLVFRTDQRAAFIDAGTVLSCVVGLSPQRPVRTF